MQYRASQTNNFTGWKKTSIRSAILSGCMRRATGDGLRRNFWRARATELRAADFRDIAAALRNVLQRNYFDFVDLEFSDRGIRYRQRPSVHSLLPTYTAIAWYHKKLPADLQGDLQKAVQESRNFAGHEYADALMVGDGLPAARRTEIAQKLSRLTGLSGEYLERSNLRIEIQRFDKELLRDQRRTVGRLDGRFTGIDEDAAGARPEYDPSLAAIVGPYTATFHDYVRGELKFESDLFYEYLTGRVRPWNYEPYENRYLNVAETLRVAMTQNPFLRVFVGKGYYDLATPFYAAEYTFDHLSLDDSLRSHLSGGYYEAGHMMYVHHPSLVKLKADLSQFIVVCTDPKIADAKSATR